MIAAELLIKHIMQGEYEKRVAWCKEKFGPEALFRDHVDNDRPWLTEYTGDGHWRWYFAREEYATMFALRWI